MKKCEIRRSAAEAFVNTLSVLRQAERDRSLRTDGRVSSKHRLRESCSHRLYEKHRAELSENRAADTETAVERLRFLIAGSRFARRAKPKDEHETPA